MKIAINPGHTLRGVGTGAVGILSETIENRKIAKRVIQSLIRKGITVIDCTIDESLNDLKEAVKIANNNNVDIFCSIHLNAGGGDGTETYVYKKGGKSEAIAQRVNENIYKSCDFKNRGIKEANFYVLKYTNAPAILVEVCFVDSKIDANKLNSELVADAIVKGLIGEEVKFNASVINITSYLNVRDKPNGKVIDKLFNNQNVQVFELSSGFRRIKYISEKTNRVEAGWCSQDYLQLNNELNNSILYRIRKSWEDQSSQIGAFRSLENAKKVLSNNPGYFIFDNFGQIIS